ncbi:hypothetical protein HCN44_000718 [Aphidius gifuensis]|uniref:W2 domain-containing protein n=1 Tax=Aphidius gifuensis TaxID=684658 RepID=A0A834XP91_APHGI|nr:eukaryotic translation initiation factor 4 gamma 3-like [Aphidius gifuensis]KAF7990913.1 hypothetical protein HCN44_000718 [Aphidius gifuensis]
MDQKKSNVKMDQRIKTLIDVSQRVSDTNRFIEIAIERVKTKIRCSAYPEFIRRSLQLLNREELFEVREKYWSMIAQMIINNMFPLPLFQSEYRKMLEETTGNDLLWTYRVEILKTLIIRGAYPLKELISTTSGLKKRGLVGKLVGKLFKILVESEGKTSIAEKWNDSGIEWNDLLDKSLEDLDEIISMNDLQFLTICETDQLSNRLFELLRESSPHDKTCIIRNWINENVVEEKTKKPKFVRMLFTAILESGIDLKESSKYFFGEIQYYQPNRSKIINHLPLMEDYIDDNLESELQCLYALTRVSHQYGHPPGFAYDIIKELHQQDHISIDAIFKWVSNKDDTELLGHREAIMDLLSRPLSLNFESNSQKLPVKLQLQKKTAATQTLSSDFDGNIPNKNEIMVYCDVDKYKSVIDDRISKLQGYEALSKNLDEMAKTIGKFSDDIVDLLENLDDIVE